MHLWPQLSYNCMLLSDAPEIPRTPPPPPPPLIRPVLSRTMAPPDTRHCLVHTYIRHTRSDNRSGPRGGRSSELPHAHISMYEVRSLAPHALSRLKGSCVAPRYRRQNNPLNGAEAAACRRQKKTTIAPSHTASSSEALPAVYGHEQLVACGPYVEKHCEHARPARGEGMDVASAQCREPVPPRRSVRITGPKEELGSRRMEEVCRLRPSGRRRPPVVNCAPRAVATPPGRGRAKPRVVEVGSPRHCAPKWTLRP